MKTDEEIGLGTAATAVQQQQQINKPAASSSRTLASILSKKSSFARPMTPSVIITDETITSPHLVRLHQFLIAISLLVVPFFLPCSFYPLKSSSPH